MWKALASAKLAIVLMTLIVGASIAGTLCPPERANDLVFGTLWFRGGMALLCLNIVACTLSRGRISMMRLGSFLAHISILLILAGAIYGGAAGKKGTLMMAPGEVADAVPTPAGPVFPLGFQVQLEDFHVERDCHEVPILTASLPDRGQVASLPVKEGASAIPAGTDYQFTILHYYPDFVMGEGGGSTKSQYPNNPAVQVVVKDQGGEKTRWVFAKYPDWGSMHGDAGDALAFALDPGAGGRIKQFKSRLAFYVDGRPAQTNEIWVNHPARFGGYTFYQASYDQEAEAWSGLQVVKDPGVPIVYGGFAVQIAGVVLIIFLNPILRARQRARSSV